MWRSWNIRYLPFDYSACITINLHISFIIWRHCPHRVFHHMLYITHPSPVRAQHPWICHLCFLMEVRLRSLEISAAVIEPFTSCLLAYTSTAALESSSCASILYSSSLVILSLSRSVESITRITNWNGKTGQLSSILIFLYYGVRGSSVFDTRILSEYPVTVGSSEILNKEGPTHIIIPLCNTTGALPFFISFFCIILCDKNVYTVFITGL